jgi:hypothetical protein
MDLHTELKTTSTYNLLKLIILTLIFAIFFNSSSLYVKATTLNDSTVKTVAIAILKPLSSVSKSIGINSIRTKARESIGFQRDDKIDTFDFKTANVEELVPLTPTTVAQLSPSNKLTSWIIGDSLATIPGESLLNRLSSNTFDVYGLDTRVSTGFSRPDFFNWASNIQEFVTARKPKSIIISIGANDDQSIFIDGNNIGPFPSNEWKDAYLKRLNATLDFTKAYGIHVFWVEIPPVRDQSRNERYKTINDLTRDAINVHLGYATLVETKTAFSDTNGNYSDSLPINGVDTLLRAPDGIHFTRAGGDLIADLVIEKLRIFYKF